MGLDCSHDAFHGAYSAFNRFRQCVAAATDGSFPDHYVYGPGGILTDDPETGLAKRRTDLKPGWWYWGDHYTKATHPGLYEFLCHPDCEGSITPTLCRALANELEALLPKIEALGWQDSGHIGGAGGYVAVTKRFIAGCRSAASKRQRLLFR